MSADGGDQLQSARLPQPPPPRQHHHRSRAEPYCHSAHGTLYFNPRGRSDRRSLQAAPATFPNPLIGPRPRRPHSIHIVSYPAGFIPRDLRQELGDPSSGEGTANGRRRSSKQKNSGGNKRRKEESRSSQDPGNQGGKASRVLQKILCAFGSGSRTAPDYQLPSTPTPAPAPAPVPEPREAAPRVTVQPRSRPVSLLSIGRRLSRLGDLPEEQACANMVEHMVRLPPTGSMASPTSATTSYRSSILPHRSAKSAVIGSAVTEIPSKPVASGSGLSCSIVLAEPNVFLSGFEHDGHARENVHSGTALLRGKLVLNVSKNVKLKSVTLKLVGRARTEWPEGIPPLKVDLFEEQSLRTQGLTFFHAMHNSWETEFGNQCVFTPKQAATNGRRPSSSHGLGRLSPTGSNMSVNTLMRSGLGTQARQSTGLTAKERKRLSLQSVQSRSFGKGESPALPSQAQLKGYKVFTPGTYQYSFELPIDHHQLETTRLQYGSVRWQLETVVERAGAFRPNLHGVRDVSIVRVPDQLSLEMSEPISIARQWEDQLHYDIMISGKSFPIGTRIPIAFKLTPLAKVQVHKIKIFVTESIEYWTSDRRVTRKDQGRKMLLLERTAGKPLDTKAYEGSEVRVLRGGELTPDERQCARAAAACRRHTEAQRAQAHLAGACVVEPLPEPTENLLGDLDLGLESYWAATEMEMNVQLPTCEMMARDKSKRLNPDCSWKNVNVFHWIKIVMRISRLDPDDPAGQRRRHFEISIDSPFTVLNCRATQANTSLPQYTGLDMPMYRQTTTCGCPDSAVIATDPSPCSSTGTLPVVEINPAAAAAAMPATPPAAHLPTGTATPPPSLRPGTSSTTSTATGGLRGVAATQAPNPLQRVRNQDVGVAPPRPIHLIRVPSYNPPPFDAEEPPPPHATTLMTPPPNYDLIVGTPSVDGLADYFARLAEHDDTSGLANTRADTDSTDDDDEDEELDAHTPARLTDRSGRVNVPNPRTPGGRNVPSRSFDIQRPVMHLSMAGVARRGEQMV
ncbi:hypothetical protein RB601_002063 [Gaeumannomyces tritici]